MSRRIDFGRPYHAFAEIPQTVSAKSGEPAKIQQTVSVETLPPSLVSAAPSLAKLAERFSLGCGT